jgi:hypothetical protein
MAPAAKPKRRTIFFMGNALPDAGGWMAWCAAAGWPGRHGGASRQRVIFVLDRRNHPFG